MGDYFAHLMNASVGAASNAATAKARHSYSTQTNNRPLQRIISPPSATFTDRSR